MKAPLSPRQRHTLHHSASFTHTQQAQINGQSGAAVTATERPAAIPESPMAEKGRQPSPPPSSASPPPQPAPTGGSDATPPQIRCESACFFLFFCNYFVFAIILMCSCWLGLLTVFSSPFHFFTFLLFGWCICWIIYHSREKSGKQRSTASGIPAYQVIDCHRHGYDFCFIEGSWRIYLFYLFFYYYIYVLSFVTV
jgi:hypothetical protein